MKTMFLHIGTHKTGSTSIQSFLGQNRKKLLRKGFLYPESCTFGENNHSPIAWEIGGNNRFDSAKYGDICSLKEELLNNSGKDVIISGEEFEFFNSDQIVKLYNQFSKDYNIVMIVYFRRQDQLITAEYAEWVKQGIISMNFNSFWRLYYENIRFQYFSMFERWKDVLGEKQIIVRSFEKEQLYNNDVICDFLNLIGLSNLFDSNFQSRNISLGTKKIKLMKYALERYELLSGDVSYIIPQKSLKKIIINYDIRLKLMNSINRWCNNNIKDDFKFHGFVGNESIECYSHFIEQNHKLAKTVFDGKKMFSKDPVYIEDEEIIFDLHTLKIIDKLVEKIVSL